MSRRTRSFFFDNKNGKLFTSIAFTLKDIENEVEGTDSIDGTKVADFARSAIQTSVEPFIDSDIVLMTAAAIDNRINVVTDSIIDSAPGALDTLNELAAALGDDANFSTTVTNSIALKANSADLATVATSGSYNDLTNKPAAGISNIVEDTTPQLGGTLDTNGNGIGSGSANIFFHTSADGGFGYVSGNIVKTNGYNKLYLDRGELVITDNNDAPLYIKPPTLDGSGWTMTLPAGPGTAGQVMTTDGSGNLSFADAASGGEFDVVATTTLDDPNAYSTSANDQFGYSVSVSGNYAIVGARWEGDADGSSSGKAYIFDVTTGSLVHTLDNPNAYNTSSGDQFGWAVAISGNYAIVGALYEGDPSGSGSGKAYIFNVTTGSLVHTLDNPNAYNTSVYDQFGWAVAISGNYAIVAANGEDDAGGSTSGKAYIFNVTTGSLVHTLDNPNAYNTSLNDRFAESVAISGNYAIVGARGEDESGQTDSGKAYIFDVTTGSLVHTLSNPNAYGVSGYDNFGWAVAIDGNYAIVSAKSEEDPGVNSGKAYIFNVTTGSLVHTLDNPNAYNTSDYDYFGNSVAISGNYAIVGAFEEDDASGTQSGKAYIFDVTTGSLVHTLDNPNPYGASASDNFGYDRAVAISGNYVIVGAINEDDAGGNDSGKAYIFKTSGLPYVYSPPEIASFAPSGSSVSTGKAIAMAMIFGG